MSEITPGRIPLPPEEQTSALPPAVGVRSRIRWRWAVRVLSRPVFFAWRRPRRAAAWCGVFLVLGLGLLAGGLFAWTEYHLRAARTAVARGHNTVAVRHLQACRVVRPDHPEALLLSARVAWRTGSWDDAEGLLDYYWHSHGEDEALVLERLVLRAAHGEVEAAGPALLARIQADGPTAPLAREAIATGLLYRFRWQDAGRLIDRWLEHSPGDTTALLLRGKLQEQRQQTSEAILTYKLVLEADPDQDEARLRLTTLLLTFSQTDDAVAHLDYLRHRLPNHAEVQIQWVRALELQGRSGEARAALEECLRRFPEHPGVLAEAGKIATRDGNTQVAEEYFAKAIRRDPGSAATRYQYALSLARNGKPAEAAKEQQAIRQLDVDNERITELIRGQLQRTPNDPAVHHEIGMISVRAGQTTDALRWFRSALQADPNHAPTHRVMAAYYHQAGNPVLAARHRALAGGLGGQTPPP